MVFDVGDAIRLTNQAISSHCDRYLSDLEIAILQGVWDKLDYDQIAARTNYATSYISQDLAPNLWKLLSVALGEKVKKGNFKSAIQRYGEKQSLIQQEISKTPSTVPMGRIKEGDRPGTAEPTPSRPEPAFSSTFLGLSNLDFTPASSFNSGLPGRQSPAPSSPKRAATRQLPQNYIERHSLETVCFDAIRQPGALVRLKAPRLMGKTSLILKVLADLAQANCRIVKLSFRMADREVHLSDLNRCLRWICANISRELDIPCLLQEYWEEADMGAKVSCTAYFEDYLLSLEDSPFVLCLDDMEILFDYPEICEDFLGLLRSWYEKARTRELWMRLRLIIIYATNAYPRLNWNQSPFNVGLPLELPDWTQSQARQLAEGYNLCLDECSLGALLELVGGHPALLDQALVQLKLQPGLSLSEILANATTESSLFGHHLRDYWLILQARPDLAQAFQQVLLSPQPVCLPPILSYQLQSLGLIKLLGNQASPRCPLYQIYFRDRLTA